MKRTISFLLVLVLILTVLPVNAQATKGGKLIALTFDDGPHKTYTKQLLDGLQERGVHVTFFMVGQNAASYPDLVQRAYDEGHEIANHTYTHPDLNEKSSSTVSSEITKTSAVLNKSCGAGTKYLVRPPYGNANSKVLSAIGAPAITWSLDTEDWRYRNSSHVYNYIVNNAYDGAIILCHDIHATTIPGALQAVDALLAQGYEFVTVSELFRRRGVTLKNGTKYNSCKNNGTDLGPVEAPEITYEPATGGIRVTITSENDAPIYYSTDDSKWSNNSKCYTGSFVTKCPVEIRAVAAFNMNGGRSEETTLKVELLPCATPELTMIGDQMKLSCATSGVPIYYTLDGTKPDENSPRYTGYVTVEPGTVIRAVAGGDEYALSKELKLYYTPNGNLFADVMPTDWFADKIDRLFTMGLMAGVGNNMAAPNGQTTRGMVVSLLYRYAGETLENGWTKTNPFTDVESDEWYAKAVEWSYRTGLVAGYEDNTFRPNRSITRQEMAKIIVNFLEYHGNPLQEGEDCRGKFKDGSKIAAWALSDVNAAVAAGLMVGDDAGKLNPLETATRAEFATVLLRMIDLEAQMEAEELESADEV